VGRGKKKVKKRAWLGGGRACLPDEGRSEKERDENWELVVLKRAWAPLSERRRSGNRRKKKARKSVVKRKLKRLLIN